MGGVFSRSSGLARGCASFGAALWAFFAWAGSFAGVKMARRGWVGLYKVVFGQGLGFVGSGLVEIRSFSVVDGGQGNVRSQWMSLDGFSNIQLVDFLWFLQSLILRVFLYFILFMLLFMFMCVCLFLHNKFPGLFPS